MMCLEETHLIEEETLRLGATIAYPEGKGPYPAVVLAGGSMSHSRDGDLVLEEDRIIPRKAVQNIAHRLAHSGIASIRYDKPGFYESVIRPERPVENRDHVNALHAAFDFLSKDPRIDSRRLFIAGESAGAYYTCLFARTSDRAFAYILLGALASSTETLFRYNYRRTVEYARRSEECWQWVEDKATRALAVGLHYEEMFRKARAGERYYRLKYKGRTWDWYLPPLREQLQHSLEGEFSHLKRPVLVLQGENDMNVPPGDARLIEARLRSCGNQNVSRVIIPSADHSFQKTPETYEERLRERISLDCLKNPYSTRFYEELENWIINLRIQGG